MSGNGEPVRHGVARAPVRRRTVVGVACAVAVVGLFSGFTLVSRLGNATGLSVPDIAALRFFVAGIILLPFFMRYRLKGIGLKEAVLLAALGGLGFALFAFSGFSRAPASHGAVFLHGTLPLFTFLIGLHVAREPFQWRKAAGVVIITTGIAVMAFDTLRGSRLEYLVGDACLLAASCCWSAYGVLVRRLGIPAVQAASTVAVFSMIAYVPVYAVFGDPARLAAHAVEVLVLQAVFQGLFIGVLSIFLYTRAVVSLGAGRTALFTAAVPGITGVGGMVLLNEVPSLEAWVGVTMVSLGMVVAVVMSRPGGRAVLR